MVLQQDQENIITKSGSFVELEAEAETKRCKVIAGQASNQQN
jgi:hypothetical protein